MGVRWLRVDAHDEDARLRVLTSSTQHPAMRTTTLLRIILAIQHLVVRGFFFEEQGRVDEGAALVESAHPLMESGNIPDPYPALCRLPGS